MGNSIIEFAAQVVDYDSDQLRSVSLKRIYDLADTVLELSKELTSLRERDRWRRQRDEPAPEGVKVVTLFGTKQMYGCWYCYGESLKEHPDDFWRPFPEFPEEHDK